MLFFGTHFFGMEIFGNILDFIFLGGGGSNGSYPVQKNLSPYFEEKIIIFKLTSTRTKFKLLFNKFPTLSIHCHTIASEINELIKFSLNLLSA